mgnify:CR=1 FL=1
MELTTDVSLRCGNLLHDPDFAIHFLCGCILLCGVIKILHLLFEVDFILLYLCANFADFVVKLTTHCICGNPLCDAERQHISAYLDMMPPRSYTSLYQDFSKTAKMWGRGYDKSGIEKSIMTVLENNEQAEKCDVKIHELDEAEKKSPDIEDLIVARQQAEQEIIELDDKISKIEFLRDSAR